jgi:phosphoglycerate kinase
MKLKLLKDAQIEGKTILYKSPYDIGVKKDEQGNYVVKDTARIEATLPTLKYLLEKNCKVVIHTWVKRPDGKVVEELRTTPHATALSELIGQPVLKANDCVGEEVRKMIKNMKPKELLMLENTRFHPEEMIDDTDFAKELAKNGDFIVFDGFPQAHRIHASTTGVLKHLPSCVGLYFQKEFESLTNLVKNPQKPFVTIIGGAKVSDKIDAIFNLGKSADKILTGGVVANVFLKALGKEMGDSYMEDVFVDKVKKEEKDWVEYAKEILSKYPNYVITPLDLIVADSIEDPKETKLVNVTNSAELVPPGWAALDIGPKTQELYKKIISAAKTVYWNGPLGMFEDARFAEGSMVIANAIEPLDADTTAGGGDTIEVIRKYSDPTKYDHISLAGGAGLEILSGKELPTISYLSE